MTIGELKTRLDMLLISSPEVSVDSEINIALIKSVEQWRADANKLGVICPMLGATVNLDEKTGIHDVNIWVVASKKGVETHVDDGTQFEDHS